MIDPPNNVFQVGQASAGACVRAREKRKRDRGRKHGDKKGGQAGQGTQMPSKRNIGDIRGETTSTTFPALLLLPPRRRCCGQRKDATQRGREEGEEKSHYRATRERSKNREKRNRSRSGQLMERHRKSLQGYYGVTTQQQQHHDGGQRR